MRSAWMLLVSLMIVPLLSCSDDRESVGDACSEGTCSSGLECRLDLPGGFCAQSCDVEGAQGGCPFETLCARQFEALLCSPVCDSQSDCREGYACDGVSGTSQKTCQVKQ